MSREKHSSSFKSKTSSNSNSSKHNTVYGSGDQQRVFELQKRVEEKEEEIKSLKSKNKDTQNYQQKYEDLENENQLLKNQIFQLQNNGQNTNNLDQLK
jgi:cell shape-determining protein MreC